MAYFLAKTDPETYSIDDLKRDGTTEWDDVRNPTAVNFIKTSSLARTVDSIYRIQREERACRTHYRGASCRRSDAGLRGRFQLRF